MTVQIQASPLSVDGEQRGRGYCIDDGQSSCGPCTQRSRPKKPKSLPEGPERRATWPSCLWDKSAAFHKKFSSDTQCKNIIILLHVRGVRSAAVGIFALLSQQIFECRRRLYWLWHSSRVPKTRAPAGRSFQCQWVCCLLQARHLLPLCPNIYL